MRAATGCRAPWRGGARPRTPPIVWTVSATTQASRCSSKSAATTWRPGESQTVRRLKTLNGKTGGRVAARGALVMAACGYRACTTASTPPFAKAVVTSSTSASVTPANVQKVTVGRGAVDRSAEDGGHFITTDGACCVTTRRRRSRCADEHGSVESAFQSSTPSVWILVATPTILPIVIDRLVVDAHGGSSNERSPVSRRPATAQ